MSFLESDNRLLVTNQPHANPTTTVSHSTSRIVNRNMGGFRGQKCWRYSATRSVATKNHDSKHEPDAQDRIKPGHCQHRRPQRQDDQQRAEAEAHYQNGIRLRESQISQKMTDSTTIRANIALIVTRRLQKSVAT